MPAYLVDQRSGIPEADAFMNSKVGPLLNSLSKQLLNDPSFQANTPAIKRDRVKTMIGEARSTVRAWLGDGLIGNYENKLEDQRRKFMTRSIAMRDEARKKYGITTPDRDLTENEIILMQNYISMYEEFYGSVLK
jgi:hypothetical protein